METMIQVNELTKVFKTDEVETWALDKVNIEIGQGEFVAVMGPSGCGKSTLLHILGLLDSPSSGQYLLDGKDVSSCSESKRNELRKGMLGFVFQSFNLIDELTVQENIALPLLYMGVPKQERQRRVEEAMARMDIMHRSRHYPRQISGGQQQRTAIARAIVTRPKLILADEPTTALDVTVQAQVLDLLKDLQKENAVLAFVDENLSDNEAKALQSTLEKIPGAADCTFVSRQEARDSYVEQYDEDDLYSNLDPSIFRHRYVIHLTDAAQMQQVVSDLEATPGIVKVRADEAISNGFLTVRNVASLISIALIAVLLVISVFIISNTIKLTTFDRRDEIAIMKMVGATDGFIRWPFVYEGLLIGLMGAVIAFGLQWLLYEAISKGIAGSDTLQLLRVVSFRKIWGPVAGVFGLVGILVGVGGSLTAIRKFLRV